jgi:hypothetical protein
MMMNACTRVSLVALVLTAVAGCADAPTDKADPRTEPANASDVELVSGSDAFLNDALTDWVSYSTDIALVTVVDEREHEPSADVVQRNEGYVGRSISVQIERVPWRAAGPLHAPQSFSGSSDLSVVRVSPP